LDRSFDETYLVGLRTRDPETEAHLVRFFSKPLWLKARSRLRSPELIEEACQETFLRVFTYFRSGKSLEKPDRLPAFVHGVCGNVALELLRAHCRHDQLSPGASDPPDHLNPEMQAVTAERKLLVAKILAQMPEKDRELLRLVFLEEEDRDEVCRRLGVDRGYLRVLLHRAKLRFRELLTEPEGDRPRTATAGGGETMAL
jgi:RNA polymerase sigma-70 factor (ECF subfamily)